MLATWIETAAKGRLGGPVRAGMWSTAVIGTHPIQDDQRVWLELSADDLFLGRLPAYWIENKGGNSLWIAPDSAAGSEESAALSLDRALRRGRDGREHVPGYDRTPEPARSDRRGRCAGLGSRGTGRKPTDDGSGRPSRLDLRPLLSDGRSAFLGPAAGRRLASQPLSFPGDRGRAGGRPPAGLVHRASSLGPLSAIPGRHQPADDQAFVAARPDQRHDHRHGGDGRLPSHQRRPREIAGPIHQTVLDQERGDARLVGPSSLFMCRPRSTAASATSALAGTTASGRSWRSIAGILMPPRSWRATRR